MKIIKITERGLLACAINYALAQDEEIENPTSFYDMNRDFLKGYAKLEDLCGGKNIQPTRRTYLGYDFWLWLNKTCPVLTDSNCYYDFLTKSVIESRYRVYYIPTRNASEEIIYTINFEKDLFIQENVQNILTPCKHRAGYARKLITDILGTINQIYNQESITGILFTNKLKHLYETIEILDNQISCSPENDITRYVQERKDGICTGLVECKKLADKLYFLNNHFPMMETQKQLINLLDNVDKKYSLDIQC